MNLAITGQRAPLPAPPITEEPEASTPYDVARVASREYLDRKGASYPVGQLDWLGGFVEAGQLRVEAILAPVVRCFGRGPTGLFVCKAFARIPRKQAMFPLSLTSLARVRNGHGSRFSRSPATMPARIAGPCGRREQLRL